MRQLLGTMKGMQLLIIQTPMLNMFAVQDSKRLRIQQRTCHEGGQIPEDRLEAHGTAQPLTLTDKQLHDLCI